MTGILQMLPAVDPSDHIEEPTPKGDRDCNLDMQGHSVSTSRNELGQDDGICMLMMQKLVCL